MDRGAFLRALPFLTQLESNAAWPPPTSGSVVETEIIFKEHLVSVEPKNAGPARFASHGGQDPTLFRLAACIVTKVDEGSEKASPAASSVSTSLSLSQSPKVPSQATMDRVERMHLILFLDGQYVADVDLSLLLGMDLHENASHGIPNLVMHFESCSFRIFSQESLTDHGSNDDYALLKTAASRIRKVLSAVQKQSSQGHFDEYSTPLHRNGDSRSLYSGNVLVQGGGHDSETANDIQNQEGASMLGIKRKRAALDRSWKSLQSLESILHLPRKTFTEENDVSDTMEPILTATAEELASSYCRKRHIRNAFETCSNNVQSYETQLNQVFAAGFPPPTRNRRHAASPAEMALPSEESTQALLESARALLQKQKQAFKEGLELSLLPIRE